VEQKQHARERNGQLLARRRKLRRIGDEKSNRFSAALAREKPRLLDELLRKIEGREIRVALVPQPDRHATGAATGLEQRRGLVRKIFFDQHALRFPQPEEMRRARVVDDGERIVVVGANGRGGYFFRAHVARNMPLALSSCG